MAASPDEKKAEIRNMAMSTLDQLYSLQPSAREAIRKAAGYAVFSEISTKILFAGGGGGKGVVVDTIADQETFMLMAMLQAGLGVGVTEFHLVWVFERESDLTNFVNNGFELGAEPEPAGQPRHRRWAVQRRGRSSAWRLAVPDLGRRPGARPDRRGHEVLQGSRPELSARRRARSRVRRAAAGEAVMFEFLSGSWVRDLVVNLAVSLIVFAVGFLIGKHRERRMARGRNLEQYDFYPFSVDAQGFPEFNLGAVRARGRASAGVSRMRPRRASSWSSGSRTESAISSVRRRLDGTRNSMPATTGCA